MKSVNTATKIYTYILEVNLLKQQKYMYFEDVRENTIKHE